MYAQRNIQRPHIYIEVKQSKKVEKEKKPSNSLKWFCWNYLFYLLSVFEIYFFKCFLFVLLLKNDSYFCEFLCIFAKKKLTTYKLPEIKTL